MSKSHKSSTLQIRNIIVPTSEATILLDHCMFSELVATNGQYALKDGQFNYPSNGTSTVSPSKVTVSSGRMDKYYVISSSVSDGKTAGLAYRLLSAPRTLFMHFRMLDTSKVSERVIAGLHDSLSTYMLIYTETATGYLKTHVYNGTTHYYGTINKDVTDGEWYTVGVQLNVSVQGGYTCRTILDGELISEAKDLVGGNYHASEIEYPTALIIGFNPDGNTANIAACEIRADMVEYSIEEIKRWHIYNSSFYDPLDFNTYIY